ncbi:MAG: hypothetical protein KJ749_05630, partial [Planctomycetes bacterium]|nr:hypothetical protein [Planctomycetota bacterium]
EYAPDCSLRFQHEPARDVTRLSLVFPLTNVGAGLMRSEPPEPSNQDPTDQASILEALEDLQMSASFLEVFPTDLPEEDIIIDWAGRDPASYLDPTEWSVTVLLGTSYTQPDPAGVFYVWTDVYPNVVRGDTNGSGAWTEIDAQLITQYIALNDYTDGVLDGMVTILGFASDFSLYDINHDGVVDNLDVTGFFRDGDSDRDGDVDLVDVAAFQRCFYLADPSGTFCTAMDFRGDGQVDRGDFRRFVGSLTGPLDELESGR